MTQSQPPAISPAEDRAIKAWVAHFATCQRGCKERGLADLCPTGKHLVEKIERFRVQRERGKQ
jgi:hypothetical protein